MCNFAAMSEIDADTLLRPRTVSINDVHGRGSHAMRAARGMRFGDAIVFLYRASVYVRHVGKRPGRRGKRTGDLLQRGRAVPG